MDRDIFIVFRQQFDKSGINFGPIQIMGAFYSQDKAYQEADLFTTSDPNKLILYKSWVERTKITR